MRMQGRDYSRKRVVRLIFLIYFLVILEGVIRKWLLPEYSRILFFVRDPILLLVYVLAIRDRLWAKASVFLPFGFAIAVMALVLIPAQSAAVSDTTGDVWYLAVYGWRNYFLYIPLTFVIGATFESEDIVRLVRWTLYLSVPVAMLVTAQFFSPINSTINVGTASDIAGQFRGLTTDETHTRPMGTFTSAVGQKAFVVSTLAMLMAFWLVPATRRKISARLLWVATCATLISIAVSGSRGLMLHAAIILLATVAIGIVAREMAVIRRSIWIPIALAGTALAALPTLLPEAIQSFLHRWNNAFESESRQFTGGIFGRALYGFVDFARLLGDTPMAGYGLGLGGNASTLLGAKVAGSVPLTLAETDWARHIVDLGPVVGFLFIFFRIALVLWLGQLAISATRRSNDPLPLLFFAFVSVELLYGQITGHGTVNGYTWVFTGLCLAASTQTVRGSAMQSAGVSPLRPNLPNLMR
jgi:hypothetical protein